MVDRYELLRQQAVDHWRAAGEYPGRSSFDPCQVAVVSSDLPLLQWARPEHLPGLASGGSVTHCAPAVWFPSHAINQILSYPNTSRRHSFALKTLFFFPHMRKASLSHDKTVASLGEMDSSGLKRKDTTKGPPLRVLSLGASCRQYSSPSQKLDALT